MATRNSPRPRLAARALGLTVLAVVPRALADPPAFPGPPRLLWTFGAQTRPIGLLARADVLSTRRPLALGAHAAYKSVSLELGVGPSAWALGGFLTFTVRALVEPGFYLTLPAGSELSVGRALSDPSDRGPGLRWGASAVLGLNVRVGRLWLYSRTTGIARQRLAPEYDRIADTVVDDELSLELANAVMVDAAPRGDRHVWVYAEHTHGLLYGVGTTVARPSVGVIVENLWPRVAFDLDVSYGLREGPLAGLGVIAVVWVSNE
ncbi:MAG: hypothetical protein HY909_09445 [Deltaproteobacteria bacterium]|nr:hypothetical protein [Deltaproteobacteria bacterium]